MTELEIVQKSSNWRNKPLFGETDKEVAQWAWEHSCDTKDDWDNKGYIRSCVVQTDDNEFYVIESEHDSVGDFHDFSWGCKKVEKKTKVITYYE